LSRHAQRKLARRVAAADVALAVVAAAARAETSMADVVTKVAAVDATEIAAGTVNGIVVIVAAAGGTVVIAVVVAVAMKTRAGEETLRMLGDYM
jgi:hypothetical protein